MSTQDQLRTANRLRLLAHKHHFADLDVRKLLEDEAYALEALLRLHASGIPELVASSEAFERAMQVGGGWSAVPRDLSTSMFRESRLVEPAPAPTAAEPSTHMGARDAPTTLARIPALPGSAFGSSLPPSSLPDLTRPGEGDADGPKDPTNDARRRKYLRGAR